MLNKKSQAAMEFLITYGWAIMIVLIGIGALFFLGVFNPSTPSTCNIASPFICQDVRIYDAGVFNAIYFRIASTNIDIATISAITLNGVSCPNANIKVGSKSDYTDSVVSQDITQSKNKPTFVHCLPYFPRVAASGSKVSGDFVVTWTKQFGVSHTSKGSYSGTVEE